MIKHDPIKEDASPSINAARQAWTEFLVKNLINVSNKIINLQVENQNKKEEERKPISFTIYDWKNFKNACCSISYFRSKGKEKEAGYINTQVKYKFDPIQIKDLR